MLFLPSLVIFVHSRKKKKAESRKKKEKKINQKREKNKKDPK
ncbi:MAG: hypothetical protein ACQEQP_08270 [Bacillota bacterium]